MTVKDLSDLAADSIWATSQLSGGRPADPAAAMTAPGTPSLGADQMDVDPQPFVRPIDRRAEQLTTDGQDGTPVGPIQWKRPG
jgi:hypothetical protein